MNYQAVKEIIGNNFGLYKIVTPQQTERRRLFVSIQGNICEFAPRSRKRGHIIMPETIDNWLNIEKVVKSDTNIVNKFIRYASTASFASEFVRRCLAADPSKSCFENRLSTGTRIDGEIISLTAIARFAPWEVERFRKALHERKDFRSCRFDFRGYDASLWIEIVKEDNAFLRKGDVRAGFCKEYRDSCHGYYYTLVNDEYFIGNDID